MRNKFLLRCTVVCMAAVMTLAPVNASAATLLKIGSEGSKVKTVQTNLKDLGYYTYSRITGYYGSITVAAVKRFQKDNGLYADGIIGKKTLGILNTAAVKKTADMAVVKASYSAATTTDNSAAADITTLAAADSSTLAAGDESVDAVTGSAIDVVTDTGSEDDALSVISQEIEQDPSIITGALDWFKNVRYIWDRGDNAVVTDVITGKSFTVKRTYGTNHADVEPLTKEDTNTIKEIWGGFSWTRRAVVVQIKDYIIAASMTAMPHAGVESAPANRYVRNRSNGYGYGVNLDSIKNNGASGVMDIHFLNSKTHTTGIVQKSQQDMVKKAAAFLKEMTA